MEKGFKGISYPFRFDSRGGIALSTTSMNDFTHINEGIEQLIATTVTDRVMELAFGSELKTHIFNLNDETTRSIVSLIVKEALAKDDRIEVLEVNAYEDESSDGNVVVIDIVYEVIKYRKTTSTQITLDKEGL